MSKSRGNHPPGSKSRQNRPLGPHLYEQNKPEVLKDIEEVFYFVNNRMREVIDNGPF